MNTNSNTKVPASSQVAADSPQATPAPTAMPRPATATATAIPVVGAVAAKAQENGAKSGVAVAEGVALGDIKATVETATASESRLNGTGEGAIVEEAVDGEGEGGEDEDDEETEDSGSDLDDDRPPTSMPDHRTPDERCTAPDSFPSKLRDLQLGWRLDALDEQGGWYAATVVEVRVRQHVIRC